MVLQSNQYLFRGNLAAEVLSRKVIGLGIERTTRVINVPGKPVAILEFCPMISKESQEDLVQIFKEDVTPWNVK